MFGHKHEWCKIDDKIRQEDKLLGTRGFVRTIYFNLEECWECGEQRKQIYNDWVHKPENDPNHEDKFAPCHAMIRVIGGLGYEKVNRA